MAMIEANAVEVFILCLIIVVNITGNVSLWIVVLRSRTLREITNMFILGLSASDLLVATVNMPLTAFTIIKGKWMLSNTACEVFGFLNMLTLVTSVLSLCNISINRFFMVCRPSKFKDIYTTRNAIFMIIGTVTCAILLSSPPLIGWSEYVYTPTHFFCFADWVNHQSYAYFMIGCCFGIPFAVMTICNICIIRSVRESRRKVQTTYRIATASTNSKNEENPQNKNDEVNLTCDKTCMHDKSILTFQSVSFISNKATVRETIKSENKQVHIQVESSKAVQYADRKLNDKRTVLEFSDSSCESNVTFVIQHSGQSPLLNGPCEDATPIETEQSTQICQVLSISERNENNVENNLLHSNRKGKCLNNVLKDSASSKYSNKVPETDGTKGAINRPTKDQSKQFRSAAQKRRSEEIRLAFSLIIVVVLFLACWLPYCIGMLISIYNQNLVPNEFHMFTLLMGYANSGCNPVVYGLMNQRFKAGFKKLFCFWK